MKKVLYLLMLLILPIMVNAKTVECTSTSTLEEGKNVYGSIKVSCTDGTINLFAICEVGSSFYDEVVGQSSCNVHNPYKAVAGKYYSYTFELILPNFGANDTLIIDGDDDWTVFARNGACYSEFDGDVYGCSVTTKDHLAKAPTSTTTKQGGTTTTTTTTTKKVENINVYWVQFDVNGGKEEIKQQAVEEGKTATKPTDPTRDGYKFAEWQLDGKKFDFSTKITKTITLKAKWDEITTGKENISFVNLYNFSAPYGGKELDTQIGIDTYIPWTIDLFNVSIDWYRGKSKDKVTEKVTSPYKHKAEDGYYYQAVLTLTPGKGYTLNNTKIKLNGKLMTTTKDEDKLIVKDAIYGFVVKGKDLNPALRIKDVYDTILLDDLTSGVTVELIYDKKRMDEVIVDGDNYIQLSNTKDFEFSAPTVKGAGHRNLIRTSFLGSFEDGVAVLTYVTLKAKAAGTYTTDVFFYDVDGREYRGTVTIKRSFEKSKPVNLESSGNTQALIEFAGEVDKHWKFNMTELTDKNNGLSNEVSQSISSLGGLVAIYKINVTSEEGEKTAGSCKIMIKLNDEMKKYQNYSFVYVSDDIEDQPKLGDVVTAKLDGDYLVATIPHLSTWAIAGNNDTTETTKDSKNNLILYCGIGVGVIIMGTFIVILLKKKKN